MIKHEEVGVYLSKTGAILKGHFVLTSGQHSPEFIAKDLLLQNPHLFFTLCGYLADEFMDDDVKVVIGPVTGGMLIAFLVAQKLDTVPHSVSAMYADQKRAGEGIGNIITIRPAFASRLKPGMRVAVVDDVLTTGGSLRQVIGAVQSCGAEVVAAGVLVNRGQVTAEDLGVSKLVALCDKSAPAYPAEQCPLCHKGAPINTIFGHGREFLARRLSSASGGW